MADSDFPWLHSRPVILIHLFVRRDSDVIVCTAARWRMPPSSLYPEIARVQCPACFRHVVGPVTLDSGKQIPPLSP